MRAILILITILWATIVQAQMLPNSSAAVRSASTKTSPTQTVPDSVQAPADTLVDTVYVIVDDGIPWNRQFTPKRLLKKNTFDPALSAAYTYSVSFVHGPLGSISQTSYLAHLAYEFTPDLHLYADLGLWAPLYSTLRTPGGFAREDIRQGKVEFVLPDIELEYKPSANTSLRLMFINEDDYIKAYGPWREYYHPYGPRRNSKF